MERLASGRESPTKLLIERVIPVFRRLLVAILCAVVLSGCVVEPGPYRAYWVPAHYGPYGGWHPGHWA